MNLVRQAMKVVATRGHAKFTSQDELGQCCVSGAVAQVHFGDPWGWRQHYRVGWSSDDYTQDPKVAPMIEALRIIGDVAEEQFPERTQAGGSRTDKAIVFNNDFRTTKEDVLLVMDKAAVRLDEAI